MILFASLVSLEDDEQKNEATARSPRVLTKEREMEDFPTPGEPISQHTRSSAETEVSSGAGDNKYEDIWSRSSVRVFGAQGIALPRLAPRTTLSLWRRSDDFENGQVKKGKRRLQTIGICFLGADDQMDRSWKVGIMRTFVGNPGFVGTGGCCGTTASDFSGFLEGSTNKTAAFRR